MRYVDRIRQLNVHELAVSLKRLTDNFVILAIKNLSEGDIKILQKTPIDAINFDSQTSVEDFERCLLCEMED